jgi:pimeloyl-[acyl-carrier protein] synthase
MVSRLASEPDLDFELSLCRLLNPEVLADPRPLYHTIRSTDPVHWDVFLRSWVITRYEDVLWTLKNLSANRMPSPAELAEQGLGDLGAITSVLALQMLFSDPPYHTRIRKLIASTFTPDRVAGMSVYIKTAAEKLINRVVHRGEMDVVKDFSAPLPGLVVGAMLGVPEEDQPQLNRWASDFAETFGNFTQDPRRTSEILQSCSDMTSYFRECIYRTRRVPNNGLIHAFLTAELEGDKLSEDEVIANAIGVLVGGQETATTLISTGLLTLLQHPEQIESLRREPALIASAVEELLRYNSPVQLTGRVVRQNFELGGKMIKVGEPVIAVLAAANCDPGRFPDPDRLDLSRTDNRHLAFGWATHFCLGAALSRLEMRISLEYFLSLPRLRLIPNQQKWRVHLVLRGLSSLPVTFDATTQAHIVN